MFQIPGQITELNYTAKHAEELHAIEAAISAPAPSARRNRPLIWCWFLRLLTRRRAEEAHELLETNPDQVRLAALAEALEAWAGSDLTTTVRSESLRVLLADYPDLPPFHVRELILNALSAAHRR